MTQFLARRSPFLLGAGALAVLVLAIVLLTVPGGDGGDGRDGGDGKPRPRAALPPLPRAFANPAMRIAGRLPRGWSAVGGRQVVHLRNRDGSAVIVIAAPRTQATSGALLAEALRATRKTYRRVKVNVVRGASLAGLPAKSRAVYTRNARGVPIRILLVGIRGRRHGYVLEAFTRQRAPARALVESQQILGTLRFAG